ncbi:MAG: ABC transporter ATP-binding protein [Phycisphaerales bacterium]|nr:ABC transporter ATP-binding protein [Phycisphaerales bacterium]
MTRSYRMGRYVLEVLKGASIAVRRGEFLAVMGASGSGKSTLLHILGVLDQPDSGVVQLENVDVFRLGRRRRERIRNFDIGFVFQFYHLLPELTVFENVLAPRLIRHSFASWLGARSQARAAVAEVLEQVGLSQRARHRPRELSGGERQRVAIARALVNRPKLLLADEPTGNLDAATGRGILKVLSDLNAEGQTIVMVTHDPDVASRAHRCVHLKDGRVAAET